MGGPITSTFTIRYPDRVRKLILIDPAGAREVALPLLRKVVAFPGVGELALGLFGTKMMIKGIASDLYGPDLVAEFQERYSVQIGYKGYIRAILSTIRNGMLGSFAETYKQIGTQQVPVLLFWGRDDKTVPFAYSADICAAIPQIQFHAVDDCGHIPHYEKPEVVNPILLEFLNEER
jgi:pimeloyl-ACP methyl ester carboxylesterase